MNEQIEPLETRQPDEYGVSDRYHRALHVLRILRRRGGRFFLVFVCLAIVFAGMAILQHWFVHKQLYRTTKQELASWAEQVVGEIAYKDKWDLVGYRQAAIMVPRWLVVAKNGLIVDIEGFIPGLFEKVELPNEPIFSTPQTVTSAVGETWRLFGRKVVGGSVIVGICDSNNVTNADTKLLENAARFGTTIEQAASLNPREIDFEVDYAVIDSNGELKAALGGVPLKTVPNALLISYDHLVSLVSNSKPYLLYSQPIRDNHGQEVGTVIVPKEMGLEQEALRVQDKFNYWVVEIAALLAIVAVLWLVAHNFFGQTKRVTLEEALKVGESQTIEFKSTFWWDVELKQYNDVRRLDILRSIAAFLNTKGGTLFIGVSEDRNSPANPPTVRGLDEDMKRFEDRPRFGSPKDQLQRALRELIKDGIGYQFSYLITDSLEEADGKFYWVVVVEESPKGPVFVRWKPKGESKEQPKFFVREGPRTSDLDNESTWRYIKNRWG